MTRLNTNIEYLTALDLLMSGFAQRTTNVAIALIADDRYGGTDPATLRTIEATLTNAQMNYTTVREMLIKHVGNAPLVDRVADAITELIAATIQP